MTRFILIVFAILMSVPVPGPVQAATFQDVAALDRSVAAFTGRPVGAVGGARTAIDPRLRLAQCPTLALSWRTDAHDAVVATCSGPNWRIFVPVVAEPRAAGGAAPAAIAAATRPVIVIKRGDPIMVEAGSPGFSITREGIAMGDAAQGARLLVRVADAKAPIQAIAVESGRATLPGWTE